jgi:uncharacterized membrane protein HdeD (DUF308 family)
MTDIPTTPRVDVPDDLRASLTSQQVVMRDAGLFPWWSVIGLGVLSVLLGIVVLMWPEATLQVMAALVGIWLVIGGLVRIFTAFGSGRGVGRQVLSGVVGVVLVVIGAACLRDLVATVAVLALVVAVTWLLTGVAEMAMAADASAGSRALLLCAGLVSIVLGFVFLFLPRLSLHALVLATAMGFIATGAIQMVVGVQLRRGADDAS